MREIKFRAWAKASEKMFYPDESDGWGLMSGSLFTLPNTELMQYTSLKDKNGKEICEGDILLNHFRNQKLIVFWNVEYLGTKGGGWGYKKLENDKEMTWKIDEENIEIIGNIYENSELLK